MGRPPVLLRVPSVEKLEETVEEFYCLVLLLLTIENRKGFSNAQHVPASSALQTMLCVWHFLVCKASEVKCFALVLGEMVLK